jgi:excisionase family DNA binding protein
VPKNRTMLDLVEASSYLHRSPTYLRRLVARREVRHYKVGGRLLFDVADLDALLDESLVEPLTSRYPS